MSSTRLLVNGGVSVVGESEAVIFAGVLTDKVTGSDHPPMGVTEIETEAWLACAVLIVEGVTAREKSALTTIVRAA